MLTIESTIMDMAMGVDATDCRNVVFLLGCSLDGGRRIGMFRKVVAPVDGCRTAALTGFDYPAIITDKPAIILGKSKGVNLRNRKDLASLGQN